MNDIWAEIRYKTPFEQIEIIDSLPDNKYKLVYLLTLNEMKYDILLNNRREWIEKAIRENIEHIFTPEVFSRINDSMLEIAMQNCKNKTDAHSIYQNLANLSTTQNEKKLTVCIADKTGYISAQALKTKQMPEYRTLLLDDLKKKLTESELNDILNECWTNNDVDWIPTNILIAYVENKWSRGERTRRIRDMLISHYENRIIYGRPSRTIEYLNNYLKLVSIGELARNRSNEIIEAVYKFKIFPYLQIEKAKSNAKKLLLAMPEWKQIRYTYFLLYNNINIKKELNITAADFDENSQIYLLYILVDAADEPKDVKRNVIKLFLKKIESKMEKDIEELENAKAITSIKNVIKLNDIAPKCVHNWDNYCEGTIWIPSDKIYGVTKNNNAGETFYCIRHRETNVKRCNEGYNRIVADTSKTYINWYFPEVMLATGFIDDEILSACHLKTNNYINKINGSINRKQEILSHMFCSKCGRLMRPNYRFAKKPHAAYSLTMFSCPNIEYEVGHDEDIYLNHCYNSECHSVIDSRQSHKHPDNGWVICLNCGAHQNGDWGDLCPRCLNKLDKNGMCSNCNHKIEMNHGRSRGRYLG